MGIGRLYHLTSCTNRRTQMKRLLLGMMFTLSWQILGYTPAYGGDSGAILPHWLKDPSPMYTTIFISNISDEQVTVYLTLYNVDGNSYTESSETGTNFSVERGFSGDPMSAGGATLQANATGELRVLGTGTLKTGYGQIKWSSTGSSRVALIAFARETIDVSSGFAFAVFPVNGFVPF
jgi:hypothetical protein